MTFPDIEKVTTAQQAIDVAIEWSNENDETPLGWGDLARAQNYFEDLADKFPEVREEFEENAII